MKKKILMSLCVACTIALMTGCNGALENTDANNNDNTEVSSDAENENHEENNEENTEEDIAINNATSIDVLQNVWDQMDENNKFPCYGGGIENSVEGAAGEVLVTDTNMLINTLLVPEDVIGSTVEAASLVHMMNSNTFTSAAIKVDGISTDDAANKILDCFMNNQFMCGIPEKITIAVYGDFVIYSYGEGEIVDNFMGGISVLNGAEIVADKNY